MDADAFCKAEHKEPVYAQEVVVNPNNTLRWVLVYVKEGVTGTYPAPKDPVTLDQHGCQYHPHVFGILAGQPLKVLNSDATLHNIHALPKKNAEFNIGQPFKMVTPKKFENAEVPLRVQVRRPQVDGRLLAASSTTPSSRSPTTRGPSRSRISRPATTSSRPGTRSTGDAPRT